ncbi:MAG: Uma2 family endonuclease, partial [Caldilineaceae bacterium]|nr:Uma2 family endonuclease [Caldilineaceae bacterium]
AENNVLIRQPLALRDLLYYSEDDVGVVVTGQRIWHDRLLWMIRTMLHSFLSTDDWLLLNDVFIYFAGRDIAPKGPVIAAIPGGHVDNEKSKSYRVGDHGPVPAFLLEVTSEATRNVDLETKPNAYAAAGVKEYLIIDIMTPPSEPWRLLGYRLGDTPYYEPITPDADGGLTFETIGVRFMAVDRERVDLYHSKTDERLLTPNEQQAKAKAEAQRATETEAKLAEALARIQEFEACANQPPAND